MKNNFKMIFDAKNIPGFLVFAAGILLVMLEVLICVQYIYPQPPAWRTVVLIISCLLLDVCSLLEIAKAKNFKMRVILYIVCFIMLLIINIIAGSTYLSALYCIVLTQIYINTEDFYPKLIMFLSSALCFIVTFMIGWLLTNADKSVYENAIRIFSGTVVGVLILSAHFFVMSILIDYYRTNRRLVKALKEADESKAQLKEVYEQLSETAVFEERNRIARDIHDNAGHSMTAVIMQTEAAKLLIETNPEEAKARIISANMQAKNALDQMRESVHLLAGRNASHSLKSELEEIIAQSMDGTDIKIRYSLADFNLSDGKRRFITNTLKECISNGIRHGGATAFYVETTEDDGNIVFTVSDNGSGLPEGYEEGFGLRGMREKAAVFGGNIEISGESGEGCEVTLSLPADRTLNVQPSENKEQETEGKND